MAGPREEYAAKWTAYEANVPKPAGKGKQTKPTALPEAPRRDLELDALAEILVKKRFITCHSYVGSEILMLMHVVAAVAIVYPLIHMWGSKKNPTQS